VTGRSDPVVSVSIHEATLAITPAARSSLVMTTVVVT